MPTGPIGTWQTVLDFDLSAQANQTFSSNGVVTIGGMQFIKGNTANEAAAAAIVNGSGLVIQPAAASDYATSSQRTLPYLWLPFAGIPGLANIDWSTSLRVWAYISASNVAANFDNAVFGVDNNTPNFSYISNRGLSTAGNGYATQYFVNGTLINGVVTGQTLTLGASNDIGVIWMPAMATGQMFPLFGGHIAGTIWPPASALSIDAMGWAGASSFASNPLTWPATPQELGFLLGAKRAGSGTALSITYARMRIDVRL